MSSITSPSTPLLWTRALINSGIYYIAYVSSHSDAFSSYSAHLRTKDDGETSSLSASDTASEVHKHDDRSLTALKFWKRPTIRQYHHQGLIWRSPNASEVASFELFIDLVYVAVIDAIGEVAVSNASAESFLHYVIVFAICKYCPS